MQQFLQFITWRLFSAQRVSGVLTPITRTSTTAVAASGFTVGRQVIKWRNCCIYAVGDLFELYDDARNYKL